MRRRSFISLIIGAAASSPAHAWTQSKPGMLRVGTANVQPRSAPQWVAFQDRMAALGYVEGKNFTYDHVQIPNPQAWEASYGDVVARKPDIIVAAGPELSLKSALATSGNLPIVMIAVDYDPIARGYIKTLARPANNVTGVYFQSTETAGKHLQLMKDAFPNFNAATVFWDQNSADYWMALQTAALRIGVRLVGVELHEPPYDYERAIVGVMPEDRKFLIAMASPFFFLDRVRLADLALRHGMAFVSQARPSVAAGALLSYGPDLNAMFALAANYLDRIAKGAKPIDLPVEQPTKFELVINLKTAKTLGLTIPPGVLAIADEAIE
jgi:putative tryptophan/tyrosine transport system substrate-binding protein